MELENVIKAMKVVFFNDPPGDRSSSHKIDDDEV